MEDDKSVKTGSQPENTDDVNADSSTDNKDVKAESSDAEVPWHKDPRFKNELNLLKTAKSLMEANGLEDVDDLKDLIESGRKVHGKKVDLDRLDEIAEKAATLDKYQLYWKQQEELNKQSAETPEQTIERLKKERDEVVNRVTQKEASEAEVKKAKQAVAFYEGEIKSILETVDDVSAPEKEFLAWSLGVGNDCNEIQITDKKQIKRVINDGIRKYNKLVEQIKDSAIKEYVAGKRGIPAVPSTDGTVTTSKPEPPKGFKGMRQALHELATRKGS